MDLGVSWVDRRLRVVLPVATRSRANAREHWARKAKIDAGERRMTRTVLRALDVLKHVSLPAVVHLTRVSPGKLDDDNLRGALKSVRDGVSDWIGIDDGSPLVTWEYSQQRSKREYGVIVSLREVVS
jgi:hypothetical protein